MFIYVALAASSVIMAFFKVLLPALKKNRVSPSFTFFYVLGYSLMVSLAYPLIIFSILGDTKNAVKVTAKSIGDVNRI